MPDDATPRSPARARPYDNPDIVHAGSAPNTIPVRTESTKANATTARSTATSFSRSPEAGEHTYVECGAPGGESQFRVEVDFDYGHGDVEGQPCPAGEREQLAKDENPELYRLLQEEMNASRLFEGGDMATCGAWGTDDPDEARELLAECGPLTRGEL